MPKYYTNAKLSENIAETPEGFLLCIGVPITRTGTFIYGEDETPLETNDDGEIEISRTKEDIFDVNCIASFEGKSVTINHPTDFVTPITYKELAKGHMQNVRPSPDKLMVDGKEEDALLADLIIQDHMAIQLVKNGLREVSLGYEAEYEQTGEGKGRQSTIRGNHIALVDNGRAGPACAINDNKGKGNFSMSKITELLKKLSKVADEEMKEDKKDAKDADKEDDKKDDKAKDEMGSGMDEITKMVKDLGEKIDAMTKGKDADKEDDKKDDDKAKDEDGEESSMEDRLKALETAVSKLLEKKAGDEESEDADEGEEEESEDDDYEESSMTGDTAARAEILSPGIKAKEKDIKKAALEAAYKTKEGKKVIDSLSGGKAPTFDSADKVNTLFIATSEILKASRGNGLESTKNAKAFDMGGDDKKSSGGMTAEKMNELNAARYGLK